MPIHLTCACGARYKAEERLAGKLIRCRSCGNLVAIPGDYELSSSSEAPETSDLGIDLGQDGESDKVAPKRQFRHLPEWAQPIALGAILALPVAVCLFIVLSLATREDVAESVPPVAHEARSEARTEANLTAKIEARTQVATSALPPPDTASSPSPTVPAQAFSISSSSARVSTPPRYLPAPAPTYPSYSEYSSSTYSSGEKTVHVRGYYRKDGTYVRPHMRSAPRRR